MLEHLSGDVKRPTPHQQEGLQKLLDWWQLPKSDKDWQNCVLTAPAGCGKAQPLDEPVLTTEGFKKMGDIQVGDYVYSEHGEPIKVLQTFTTEGLKMYQVNFSDESSTICCEDHLWLVYPERLRRVNGTSVMSLKQMLPNIQKEKTKKEGYSYRIPVTKPIKFPLNETMLHCYTFGYTLGNGSSAPIEKSAALVLTIAQSDFENIKVNIPEKFILSVTEEKRNTTVSLICLNETFRDWYNSYGLRGVTSTNKFIPEEFFTASKEQRISLLKGLCDSDGSCSNNKSRFTSSSYSLAKGFKQLVHSLGGTASISVNQRYDKGEIANTEYAVIFRVPFNPFTLPRKVKEYSLRPQDLDNKRSIVSAQYYGEMTGKCLVVDSPTHLYITKDYIVTHNTFLTKHFTSSLKGCYPLFVATTNEAARQMDLAGVNCKGTLHAVLGLVPITNCEVPYFKQLELPKEISDFNLLVVDEASMAGYADPEDTEALALVVNYALDVGMRILWIGDSYQLPPVESKNGLSPVFSMGFYTVALTEIVRNSGDVLEYCTKLRNMIDQKSRSFPKPPRGKETVRTITPFALREILTNHDSLELFRSGKLRIIAWRNTTVDRYNEMIRVGLHGAELAKAHRLLPTDQVLFTKPVIGGSFPEDVMHLVGNKNLKQEASVNTRAEVIALKPKELYGIECNLVKFRVEGGTEVAGYVMTTEGAAKFAKLERAFKTKLESLKSAKAKSDQWQWWHAFDACFVKLKHSYAITTHRSQGSNIDEVIVDAQDILAAAWREPLLAYKMAYTAASRTKKKLTLVMER